MYLWVKGFHVIFMVTWFAGLFYLPRLYVYHAMTEDAPGRERFRLMERKLYYGIMTPGAVLTALFGAWLLWCRGGKWIATAGWLHWKLTLVAVLVAYHLYLGHLLRAFREDRNRHGHVYYRWLNEFPVLILVAVVLLATVEP